MKEKEPTSLKAISQAIGHTSIPHHSSSAISITQEDNLERAMDLIPYMPDPPSPPPPPSPHSAPDTPTPTCHVNCIHPLKPDLLIYQEFSVKSHNPSNSKTPTNSLTSSIHAPSNPMVDQTMNNPLSPTVNHAPTSKEQDILALTDINISMLSQNGMNHSTSSKWGLPNSAHITLSANFQLPQ
ncbi:hypothetical protein EDB19DRAFT_1916276 [Suillus lakei]|nr:hypothetical protein EDB19DRAFT_1916276 [Suillus lakei]